MGRREYGQPCSLACALDRVGERWTLLIIRELALGPLRFSDLARSVGGAPTDVLTKRLRGLERDGIVNRRELAPPASATVYELTEFGRGLERPMLELGRWGMGLQTAEDVAGLAANSLPNALRVALQPPPEAAMTVGLRSDGLSYTLRIRDGWIGASRGIAAADLTLSGAPIDIIATLVVARFPGDDMGAKGTTLGEVGAEVEGDPEALEALREMVAIPERLREEAREMVAAGALA